MLCSYSAAALWPFSSLRTHMDNSTVIAQLLDSGIYMAMHAVQLFISDWVDLLTDVLAAVPEARGRLLIDMINEPDGYGFTW